MHYTHVVISYPYIVYHATAVHDAAAILESYNIDIILLCSYMNNFKQKPS